MRNAANDLAEQANDMRREANDPRCKRCGFDHEALDYFVCPLGQEWIEVSPNVCHQRVHRYQVCGLLESEAFKTIIGTPPPVVARGICQCHVLADLVDAYVRDVYHGEDFEAWREAVKTHLQAGDRTVIKNLRDYKSFHASLGTLPELGIFTVLEHVERPVYMGLIGWLIAAVSFGVGTYWLSSYTMVTPEYLFFTFVRLLFNGLNWSDLYGLVASATLTAVSALGLVSLWRWCSEPRFIDATIRHMYSFRMAPQRPNFMSDMRPLKANYAALTVQPLTIRLKYEQDILNHVFYVRGGRGEHDFVVHPKTDRLKSFYYNALFCLNPWTRGETPIFCEGSRSLIPLTGPTADMEVIVNLAGNFSQQHDEQLTKVYERMKVTHRQLTQVNLNRFHAFRDDTSINSLVLAFALLVRKRQDAGLDDYVIEPQAQ